jgi:hypothetical protein
MDAEIEPIPLDTARPGQPELDRLSNILKTFNDNFGTLFTDTDRVARRIRDDIAPKVAAETPGLQAVRRERSHSAGLWGIRVRDYELGVGGLRQKLDVSAHVFGIHCALHQEQSSMIWRMLRVSFAK